MTVEHLIGRGSYLFQMNKGDNVVKEQLILGVFNILHQDTLVAFHACVGQYNTTAKRSPHHLALTRL